MPWNRQTLLIFSGFCPILNLQGCKEKYPGCEKSESRFSNKYDKLIVEAFGGKGDNDVEKEDKIIRNISKNVTISKVNL